MAGFTVERERGLTVTCHLAAPSSTSLKLSGKFTRTPPVSARERAPFVPVVDDGTVCSIRVGGA